MHLWLGFACCLGALASASAAQATLALGGPVDHLVVSADRVAAISGSTMAIVGPDARILARLGQVAQQPMATARNRASERERILDLYAVPEGERDSNAADDLVDDELLLRERRATPSPELPSAEPLVAGDGAGGFWVVLRDHLSYVDREGPHRGVGRVPKARAIAATEAGVLLASGLEILASTDGGRGFQTVATLTAPANLLVAGAGWAAWASAQALHVARADGVRLSWPRRGTRALAACGQTLLALGLEGLLAIEVTSGATSGPEAPPARGITCAGQETAWLTAGPGLFISRDRGRTWQSLPTPALPVRAAAASGDGTLWIATASGLFRDGGASAPPPPDAPARRRSWMGLLLPRLSLAAAGTHQPGRLEQSLLLMADFPLGDRPPPPGPQRPWAQADAVASLPFPPDREQPCLREARARAVALAQAEPERARSYVRRAGRAAWLPELRLRVERRVGRDESLELADTGVGGPLGLDTTNDIRYEARATWDLSRLMFSPDEMAAQTQALRMADMRREIESLMNRLYFERRRLLVAHEPAQSLRIEELTAELDALSAGAFTACVRPGFEVHTP